MDVYPDVVLHESIIKSFWDDAVPFRATSHCSPGPTDPVRLQSSRGFVHGSCFLGKADCVAELAALVCEHAVARAFDHLLGRPCSCPDSSPDIRPCALSTDDVAQRDLRRALRISDAASQYLTDPVVTAAAAGADYDVTPVPVENEVARKRPDEGSSRELFELQQLVDLLSDSWASIESRRLRLAFLMAGVSEDARSTYVSFCLERGSVAAADSESTWARLRSRASKHYAIQELHCIAEEESPAEYSSYRTTCMRAKAVQVVAGLDTDVVSGVVEMAHDLVRTKYVVDEQLNGWVFSGCEGFDDRSDRWSIDPGKHILLSRIFQGVTPFINEVDTEGDKSRIARQERARNLLTGKEPTLSRLLVAPLFRRDFFSKLDSDGGMLGTMNGVFDMYERRFRPARPSDFVTKTTGVPYVPWRELCEDPVMRATMTGLKRFLTDLMPDELELEFLLRKIARTLDGRAPEPKLCFLLGQGSNGKSKLLELVELTLGDYCARAPVQTLTERQSPGSPNSALAQGVLARVLLFDEPSKDAHFDNGIVKLFTGGDRISVRDLYKPSRSVKPLFTPFCVCNTMPSIAGDDFGTSRRLQVVKFSTRFTGTPSKPNERAARQVTFTTAWRTVFFSLLIEKYHAFSEHGNPEPMSVKVATDAYRQQAQKVMKFMATCTQPRGSDDDGVMLMSELFAAYRLWWAERFPGQRFDSSIDHFSDDVASLGYDVADLSIVY